jgi:hypothetical protein
MEQKKEQKSQPQGGKGNQPRREQPGHPMYPQRGGASERQHQPTDPNRRQHQSESEIADEYELDIDDEAGDERPSAQSDYDRHQQQPHKAHKDF